MTLFEILKNAQSAGRRQRAKYTLLLFEFYEEFFLKRFMTHSPYIDSDTTIDFAASLAGEVLSIIETKIKNFKLKKEYTEKPLEEHLWSYLRTIADSTLDRELLNLTVSGESEELSKGAAARLADKYRAQVEEYISEALGRSETAKTAELSGFKLEQFLEQESTRLSANFFETKFEKICGGFINHKKAIFGNYLESALSNFFIDYIRGQNVKKMRRLTFYRDDLPEELFEHLKELKGYGNLFYYKKRYDCLTVRDTGKALTVIKDFGLSESALNEIRYIFKRNNKRAEYQRIIDNITAYIKSSCKTERCSDRLLPGHIKSLLYANDYVMQRLLKKTEQDIERAQERLKRCVTCLELELADFR